MIRSTQNILSINRLLIFLVALYFMLFPSCDNTPPQSILEPSNKFIPIQFTESKIITKADIPSSLPQNQTVGILAYYLQPEEDHVVTWSSTATPNFMYNQLMTVNESGQLTYSPIKYWPGNESDKIKFFAYSPHSTEANGTITPSSATMQGFPTLSYTPSTDISKQIDLLIAVTPPLNSSPVSLNFKHALTQVSFSAKCVNNLSNQVITITGIEVGGLIDKADCTFTNTGFQWTNVSMTQEYRLTGIKNPATPIGDTFVDLTGSLYLIPLPESSTSPKLSLELTIGESQMKKTIERDLTGDWSAGKDTNYQLTIDVSNLLLN